MNRWVHAWKTAISGQMDGYADFRMSSDVSHFNFDNEICLRICFENVGIFSVN